MLIFACWMLLRIGLRNVNDDRAEDFVVGRS
jgi:hypothetical protein